MRIKVAVEVTIVTYSMSLTDSSMRIKVWLLLGSICTFITLGCCWDQSIILTPSILRPKKRISMTAVIMTARLHVVYDPRGVFLWPHQAYGVFELKSFQALSAHFGRLNSRSRTSRVLDSVYWHSRANSYRIILICMVTYGFKILAHKNLVHAVYYSNPKLCKAPVLFPCARLYGSELTT